MCFSTHPGRGANGGRSNALLIGGEKVRSRSTDPDDDNG